MFKSILPGTSKRISNSEFMMVTPQLDTEFADPAAGKDKENIEVYAPRMVQPKSAPASKMHKKTFSQPAPKEDTNVAFEQLLDDLQIPSTVRPKLAGMESSVKAAMLKSSKTIANTQPQTTRGLRKAHSIESLESPKPAKKPVDCDNLYHKAAGRTTVNPVTDDDSAEPETRSRGKSVDIPRPKSRAGNRSADEGVKGKDKKAGNSWTPSRFCTILDATPSAALEVEIVKKLRLHLRNEPASWTEEFLRQGGYDCLLSRISELLQFEWREEQHDDKLLHSLLECIKAISTSAVGCATIRSSFPSPFSQLITLLYSDKKPGEVASRYLIIELIQLLFDLFPTESLSSFNEQERRRDFWDDEDPFAASTHGGIVALPHPHKSVFALLRSLLLTPAPRAAEAPEVLVTPHEFIDNLHKPRVYKTYLQELSDLCRDYFWVFCHPNNTIWNLAECDDNKVERPRAPGGMTGGVEAEAMRYMTLHFKFINQISVVATQLNMPREHQCSAYNFHSDLFFSGLERIIMTGRRASTVYYPTLHLEIARYVQNASLAGYDIPWAISRIIGSPPSAMCKPGVQSAPPPAPSKSSVQNKSSRTRGGQVNGLPLKKGQANLNVNGNGNGKKVTPATLFDP
ncbi:hypothetical protein BDM02DRAFT_3116191 [Thelephora ganbajun]|uniref:Uncharacterized protein n=1 Tax=Thelephora ganbajun TaxID=370292 RepID=A0ACB6ZFR8_THEGA|nr:hypothetical protein BDM02DRAFT_3116191 [Thelephora ganbajun]